MLVPQDAPESPEVGPPCIELLDMTVEAPLVFAGPPDAETNAGSSSKLPAATPGPLIHMLMENVHPPKEIDRVYDRDYLSRRFRAFGDDEEGTDPWKGASMFEKNLVSCVDEDGALRRDRVLKFLACFVDEESDDWALPFAILERSQREDEEDVKLAAKAETKGKEASKVPSEKTKRVKRKRSRDDDDSDYGSDDDEEEEEDDDEEEWGKTDEEEMDSSSSSHGSSGRFSTGMTNARAQKQSQSLKAVTEMSPEVVKVQKPQSKVPRMELFVQHGGLKLLSRWLRFTTKPKKQAGSLMLPLLALIAKVPFSFQAIERSRINKTITTIRRELKRINTLEEAPQVHPTSGNNPVTEVLQAINEIVRLWKEKQAEARKASASQQKEHPLAKINSKLSEIADGIIASQTPKPKTGGSVTATTSKVKLSVKELARIEREKEKGNHLIRDLEAVRKKRAEANRKLLEAQARLDPPKPPTRIGTNSIRWKDGLRTGKPKPELLESVRIFNKYQTAAGNDVPMDSVNVRSERRGSLPELNEIKLPPDHGVAMDNPMPDPSYIEQKQPPEETRYLSSSFTSFDRPPTYELNQRQGEKHAMVAGVTSSFALLDQPLSRDRVYQYTPATLKNDADRAGADYRGHQPKKTPYGNGKKKKKKRFKKSAQGW